MKKILLCGANGFIGKNILKRFSNKENYQIVAVYNTSSPPTQENSNSYGGNVRWVRADLRNQSEVAEIMKDIDIVLQYAATTTGAKDIVSKPYIHVTDNAVMNSLLLREAYENDVGHFIMPSCTIMYKPSETPLSENDFDESEEIYPTYYGAGNTKVYLEKMCKFYAGFGKTKHTVLRQSNIYGPHDKYDLDKSHVFGATITKVMTNDDKVIVWGTGEEERDFLFVDDLLDLIESAIEKQTTEYELVNASFGQSLSIGDLVHTVVGVSGKDLKIEYDETKPTIKTKLAVDNTRAKKVFGWAPRNDLTTGLKKTIKWYKNNEL
jgi:GDP-L-fucose synthase